MKPMRMIPGHISGSVLTAKKAASYVQELGLSEEHPVYQCNFSGELQSLLFQMQKAQYL